MNKKIFSLICVTLTFLALILWFVVPAIKYDEVFFKFDFSFIDLTFGKKMTVLGETSRVWNFSFLNLLTLLLILITLGLYVLDFLEIKIHESMNDSKNIISAIFALLSGIFILLVKVFAVATNGDSKEVLSLTAGTIIIFVLLLTTAACSIFLEYGYDKLIGTKDTV